MSAVRKVQTVKYTKREMCVLYGYEVYHEEIMKKLISAVREARVQHAYIFEGESGIGKLKAARLFAAALVCNKANTAPCGECAACYGARADTNPDIRYVTDEKSIGVDLMREVISDAYVKPFESKKKVYIIKDGNSMTEQAQNAFLKMLEEPPEYAVFIILTTNASQLLQTVISRCGTVRFGPLSKERVKKYISEKYPDADGDFLASYAMGNIGRVDEIMEREDFFALRKAAVELILPLTSQRRLSAYKIAEFLEKNRENALEIVGLWKSMLRDIVFINNDAEKFIINKDLKKELSTLAGRISSDVCIKAEETLEKAEEMLSRYVNPNARAVRAIALYLSFTIKKGSSDRYE